MDPNQEIDDLDLYRDEPQEDDSMSVDDFIRELEAKEKDLHITLETTVIEIEQGFDDVNPSVFRSPEAAAAAPQPTSQKEPEVIEEQLAPESELDEDDESEEDDQVDELMEQIDGLNDELAVMKQTVLRLEGERKELSENSQRRAKDFAAYKARTEREREEFRSSQAGDLVSKLLPSIDNLDRALEFAENLQREKNTEFSQFFEGIKILSRQINETFSGMGVEPIHALGEIFDPHLHEAVATEEETEFPDNTVCEELLKGYKIGDRVLRHSMVKVAVAAPTKVGEEQNIEAEAETEQDGDNVADLNNEIDMNESVSESAPTTDYEIEIFSMSDEDVGNAEFIPSPDPEPDSQQNPPEIPQNPSE